MLSLFDYITGIYSYICTVELPTVYCTELNINFQESDYVVNEGDKQGLIILQLREVQNSFTMTLNPVSITEARKRDRHFNLSTCIGSVSADAEAMPGKVDILV